MKAFHLLALALTITLAGCATQTGTPLVSNNLSTAPFESDAREPAIASLFPSDQAVLSDEAVARVFSSKLELPAKLKIALMKFPDEAAGARYYGRYYWRDEQYLKLQQAQMDALSKTLLASPVVTTVTPLPSLMTPKQPAIPIIREAAVRMQADLLLVFRINSDTYSQYRTFAKDQVKAYSTCELVLLDVRTGLVPFTRVISSEKLELKQSSDLDLAETIRRAEQDSSATALENATKDLVNFINSAAKKTD
jgi:hypothetical protein